MLTPIKNANEPKSGNKSYSMLIDFANDNARTDAPIYTAKNTKVKPFGAVF